MRTGDARLRSAREAKRSKREQRLARQQSRERFARAKVAEQDYARRLRQIARAVGHLVAGYAPRGWVGEKLAELEAMLYRYADTLRPWAKAVAARMLADVAQRDAKAWKALGQELGRALQAEIAAAPTGQTLAALQAAQVDLITSLPRKVAQRVHKLTLEALSSSQRFPAIAKEIRRTGAVTESRATLIARTESGRACTNLTMSRALHLGSPGYTWETAKDNDCRESHAKMQGQFVRWEDPPTLDGLTGHAGTLPNCRCWTNPQIPESI